MLSNKIKEALNKQIKLEGNASNQYLAISIWAENSKFEGVSKFLYTQSEEERNHMIKLINFINKRNSEAIIPEFQKPINKFNNLTEAFTFILNHEIKITNYINNLIELALHEKDYATHSFLQSFINEQVEEEYLYRLILEKLYLTDSQKEGLYLFDKDIINFIEK